MSIKGQGHSLTLVKVHSDFKVKSLTFGLYTQVSDSGPLGPLVLGSDKPTMLFLPLINVKMPTIVGILTFMSRKNVMLS